ncbi:polysaccharide pyruvyl transferase family protein [Mucilaginibacter sp. JRF]|uniref:polysaccharide pyruvyl transferase family protein n=1 Tax=Mucilaginibacter sp. JRF TaxID=2780088 RepID=UPI001882DAD0|nr:polysaccharide pyruvyl transferase family protein [Mucilaginibacter sp. JRF]MBE9585858.1 polysaccharide pyruvyl transferase family protein [Mucilaginibacter sp. JRF]
MTIELRGVEFVNKGAELMLRAILDQLRTRYPSVVIIMQTGSKTPKEKLKASNIGIKFSSEQSNRKGAMIPGFIRRMFGYYLEKEVDVVIDASGFAFGDQWGAQYAERRLGAQISKWNADGKKVILLAQAFGPFEDAELKVVMAKIVDKASLIFAREEESYKHITGVKNSPIIKRSPDFTNLIKGKVPATFDKQAHEVAIIPNYKMVESKASAQGDYIEFLKHAIATTRNLNLKPYFLIHEGKRDEEFAHQVNKMLDVPLAVIKEDDPLVIKGIISTAKFIICSRFHGVVSALSQGVPCVTTSWSHKYAMLVAEYDFTEGLINDLNDYTTVDALIQKLAVPANRDEVSARLLERGKEHKINSAKMWEQVFELIDKKKA